MEYTLKFLVEGFRQAQKRAEDARTGLSLAQDALEQAQDDHRVARKEAATAETALSEAAEEVAVRLATEEASKAAELVPIMRHGPCDQEMQHEGGAGGVSACGGIAYRAGARDSSGRRAVSSAATWTHRATSTRTCRPRSPSERRGSSGAAPAPHRLAQPAWRSRPTPRRSRRRSCLGGDDNPCAHCPPGLLPFLKQVDCIAGTAVAKKHHALHRTTQDCTII